MLHDDPLFVCDDDEEDEDEVMGTKRKRGR